MSEIATPTRCTLCGRTFYGPAAGLGLELRAGEEAPPRMMHFVNELIKHIAAAHPAEFQLSMAKASELQGWMILSHFSSDDRRVTEQRDYFRWSIHQQTLNVRAQNLETRARQIATEFIQGQRAAELS